MAAQPSQRELNIIIDRAGMSSQYPGYTETSERFDEFEPSVYKNEKFSCSIGSEAVKNHQIRRAKYKNKENFKVTGASETKIRYVPHKPEDYKREHVKRSDLNTSDSTNSLPKSKFEGNSEYTVIYSRMNECQPKKESPLTINPYKNIDCASRGRPNEPNNMFTKESLKDAYTTHTMVSHQWPRPENNRRFDWMQNKAV